MDLRGGHLTKVFINLDNLTHNISLLQELAGGCTLWPAIKANAYGHGAEIIAEHLIGTGYNILAVAHMSEAIELIEKGIKAMIGKGYRSQQVRDALEEYGAVHLATIGGAGALLSKHIVGTETIAFEELGAEAVRKLEVVDFPAIVAYDAHGSTVYNE